MTNFDLEYMMRFVVWSSTLATVFVASHWYFIIERKYRIPIIGLIGKAIGWTIHQRWYLDSWLLFSSGNMVAHAEFEQSKWIIYGSEALIVASTVLILSPYLEARLGRLWAVFGAGIVGSLMVTGFLLGYPK